MQRLMTVCRVWVMIGLKERLVKVFVENDQKNEQQADSRTQKNQVCPMSILPIQKRLDVPFSCQFTALPPPLSVHHSPTTSSSICIQPPSNLRVSEITPSPLSGSGGQKVSRMQCIQPKEGEGGCDAFQQFDFQTSSINELSII